MSTDVTDRSVVRALVECLGKADDTLRQVTAMTEAMYTRAEKGLRPTQRDVVQLWMVLHDYWGDDWPNDPEESR